MLAFTYTLLLGLSLSAADAPRRTEGTVIQATAARAYLDAGVDDGLAAGEELPLRRGPVEVGRCRVEAVSARSASCALAGARAGDRFALPRAAAAEKGEEVRLLAPPLPPEVLEAQARALATVPVALVQFEPRGRAAGAATVPAVRVEVSELAWLATSVSPFQATRAAVSVRGAELGLGLRLDVDAEALRWWSRPSPRFRPNDSSQLYVWQAALSRSDDAGAAVSFGRIMPWRIPGATILDGATAGWRFERVEVGAFGGLVPQPSTLSPVTDRATGGGYWSWDQPLGKGVSVRDEGRVAIVRSPELGTRVEAETLAAARLGRALDLSGSVRLGFGGDVKAPGNVDAARLELASRPLPHLRLAAWLAYDGLEVPRDAEPMVYAGHSRRAEASVSWLQGRTFNVTVLGGASQDLASRLDRGWVGPVVDLPRLLFGRGGLSFGYLEELGWTDGRSAWVQAVGRPWSRLRLLARVSWSHATPYAVMQDDFGLALGAVAELTHALSARLTLSSRGSFTGGEGASTAGGGTAFATLVGRY